MWLLNYAQEVHHIPERQRPRHYGPDVQHALFVAWNAALPIVDLNHADIAAVDHIFEFRAVPFAWSPLVFPCFNGQGLTTLSGLLFAPDLLICRTEPLMNQQLWPCGHTLPGHPQFQQNAFQPTCRYPSATHSMSRLMESEHTQLEVGPHGRRCCTGYLKHPFRK